MLKIANKPLTSSTSFLLAPHEEATLTGPELAGGTLHFITFAPNSTHDINQEMQATLANGVATIKLPLLTEGSFATTVDLKLGESGKLTARIAGQPLGGHLFVHIDIYLDHGLSFAQR
ncbi:MAG: hypothetical protein EON58_21995 [Alphaproteobacteria bacterium]|nr:MAG: hypothetical protein EON58_21995 [Alphaproteobacteria bacterium]